MADEKVNMGPEENKAQETLSPPGQGELPPLEENNTPAVSGEDKAAPDHVEPDPPSADRHTQQTVFPGMGEDTPAPSGKVINLSDIQAADKGGKEAPAPAPEKKASEAEQPKKRRGRPPKEQAAVSAGKKEKAAEPRTGRPSKVDKAAREEAPPSVLDKVSRGKKADKDKETGSGGAPASKSTKAVKPGKAAPVKEAAVPPPEIKLPPTPEVPPRPVEEGKIVYLKMAELHPFHTFREHPYKVQDDKAMDDLVGTIKEHGIMTPATVRPEKDGKGYEIIAEYAKHDRAEFVRVVQEAQSSQQTAEVRKQRTRLATAKQRVSELEVLLCKIYEDNILGKLSDSRYATLDAQYEKEQSELTAEISALEKAVKSYEKHEKDADRFIALIDKYENFDKLTIAMLNEFIEKILVHERDRKGSIQTTQEVEIYFNFVGRFVPPAFGEAELTPEELEEIRKREERKDRLHQNYLKRKASGAQKRYEDKIKKRKKAEIEAKKAAIRAEDIAKGVFVPVSSLPQREPMKGVQTA